MKPVFNQAMKVCLKFIASMLMHLTAVYAFASNAYQWGATDSSISAFFTGLIGAIIAINLITKS